MILVASIVFISFPISAAEKKQPVVITDETIEQYKKEHTIETESPPPPPPAEKSRDKDTPGHRAVKEKEDSDYAYWCGRGQNARTDIQNAKRAIADAQQRYNEEREKFETLVAMGRRTLYLSGLQAAEDDLIKAKAQLAGAEKVLKEIEEDARTAGALPGWPRCQR